jgi:NitT/TauT family transport system substrate-binding protein
MRLSATRQLRSAKVFPRFSSSFRWVLWTLFGVSSITFSALSSVASGGESIQLLLNWKAEPEFGGFYTAELKDEYARRGLKVKIVEGGAGTPVVQMVAAGKTEFGISNPDEVALARERGADVVAIFAVYQTYPMGFLAHAERGFKSLKDLMSAPGTLAMQSGYPFSQYIKKKYSQAQVKFVPYLGGIGSFLSDPQFSQQCFITAEPFQAEAKGAKTTTFSIADEGFNPYATVLVTRGEVLAKKPEVVKTLVDAVRAGWTHYLKDPGATHVRINQLNPAMDVPTLERIAQAQKGLIETAETRKKGLGYMSEERWKSLLAQLVELKLLNKSAPASSYFKNF